MDDATRSEIAELLFRNQIGPRAGLDALKASDGSVLVVRELALAIDRRDSDTLQDALVFAFVYGVPPSALENLVLLAFADWHESHEAVAEFLQDLASPGALPALIHLARWMPTYLDYDETRSLGRRAIWAMRDIRGADVDASLRELLGDAGIQEIRNDIESVIALRERDDGSGRP